MNSRRDLQLTAWARELERRARDNDTLGPGETIYVQITIVKAPVVDVAITEGTLPAGMSAAITDADWGAVLAVSDLPPYGKRFLEELRKSGNRPTVAVEGWRGTINLRLTDAKLPYRLKFADGTSRGSPSRPIQLFKLTG